jgi:hypothetical protein
MYSRSYQRLSLDHCGAYRSAVDQGARCHRVTSITEQRDAPTASRQGVVEDVIVQQCHRAAWPQAGDRLKPAGEVLAQRRTSPDLITPCGIAGRGREPVGAPIA